MAVTIDGTSGINTPGVVNTAAETIATTLAVTGVTTFAAGTAALPAITTTGDTNTGIFFPAADTIAFAEGGAEAMRLDSSGNLGLGVTPSASDGTLKYLQVSGTAIFSGQVGTESMRVGSNWHYNGGFKYQGTGTATTYDQSAGTHTWKTAASGTAGAAITFTESMRIDSSGNLLVGTTTNLIWNTTNLTGCVIGGNASSGGFSSIQVSRSGDLCLLLNRLASDGQIVAFARQGSQVGNINVTTTATAYNTSSDYRLKNAIAPMTGALAKVALLKPCTYKWKIDGSDGQGFIAHELDEVVPGCVTGEKDAVDAEGNPQYQSIDTSFLVATLTAAIQEQQALITALTTRITALEAA